MKGTEGPAGHQSALPCTSSPGPWSLPGSTFVWVQCLPPSHCLGPITAANLLKAQLGARTAQALGTYPPLWAARCFINSTDAGGGLLSIISMDQTPCIFGNLPGSWWHFENICRVSRSTEQTIPWLIYTYTYISYLIPERISGSWSSCSSTVPPACPVQGKLQKWVDFFFKFHPAQCLGNPRGGGLGSTDPGVPQPGPTPGTHQP